MLFSSSNPTLDIKFLTFISMKNNNNKFSFLNYKWLFFLYFKYLTYNYTKFLIDWNFLNLDTVIKKEQFKKYLRRFAKKRFIKVINSNKVKFFDWFVQLTQFKDPEKLIQLIQMKLNTLNLKKHRRMFYFVRNFFFVWFKILARDFKLKGYSLFFKGKLGKKGSVKKKKFFVKNGKISFTNKNLRMNYRTYIVWTITGVVGCGISIFF